MSKSKHKEIDEALVKQGFDMAFAARQNAYCPYSDHPVGAAILDENGDFHSGCNVEAAHIRTTCAEGTAIVKMVSSGARSIKAVFVVGPSQDYLCTPCGDCRQRIREFADFQTPIYSMKTNGEVGMLNTLDELLPHSFGPENIGQGDI